MPRAFLRLLAVLALGVAVPVHGAAAVAAGQCLALPHHHDGAGQETHEHAHDGAAGHDHASHAHPDDGGSKKPTDGGKPSHCGPCTASAAIAGPVTLPILSSPSNTKYVFSQSLPLGVPPDGVYRPPLVL